MLTINRGLKKWITQHCSSFVKSFTVSHSETIMSGHSLVIGVVGKPSVGKSTFFNSVTEGKAKVMTH